MSLAPGSKLAHYEIQPVEQAASLAGLAMGE
jgi:hypothetical protein